MDGGSSTILWTPRDSKPSEGAIKAANLFNFIENELLIRIKEAQEVVKRKKRRKTRLVEFRFNTVQMILCQELAYHWEHEIPIRWWIPKSRQMGISTWVQGVGFAMAFGIEGFHVATVAHVEGAAKEIFAKSHTFNANLAERWNVRPLKSRQEGKFEWHHESSIWVGTIKAGDALGRGPTLNGIHFSEVANFADHGQDPEEATTGALGSLADGPESFVIYESTAKGRDPFYFAGCERARDKRGGGIDRLIFLPWYLEDTYAMPWSVYRSRRLKLGKADPGRTFKRTEAEAQLARKIANIPSVKGEELWRHRCQLTDDQLIWYRDILDTKCHGKEDKRAREYPSTYEEAFTATARCMWDAESIQWYTNHAKAPLARGNAVRLQPEERPSKAEFVSSVAGRVQLWANPVPGETYVIGADVGGNTDGNDFSSAYVIRESNLEVVGAYHGNPEWEDYVEDLLALGYFFNTALLVPENNHQPAVAGALHKARYPKLYYYVNDEIAAKNGGKNPGFNTNRKTRELLLAHLDRVIRDRSLGCKDAKFPVEMETFVYVARLKKYMATGRVNKDDRIMAMALAVLQAKNYVAPDDEAETEVVCPVRRRFNQLQELGEKTRLGPILL